MTPTIQSIERTPPQIPRSISPTSGRRRTWNDQPTRTSSQAARNCTRNFRQARDTDQIVDDPDQEDQRGAAGEREQLVARDDLTPDRPSRHQPGAAAEADADEDRHASEARHGARIGRPCSGRTTRARDASIVSQSRQPHERRHEQAGDHARDERGDGTENQEIGHR